MTEHSLPSASDAQALSEAGVPAAKRARILRWSFWLPAGWLVIVIVAALGADLFQVQDPFEMDLVNQASAPDAAHWFGTDDLGRDMFARTVYGGRISLTVGLLVTLIALLIGCTLGITSGYFRGRWEALVMMYVDISLAFPGIILLLLLVTYLGNSLANLSLALGILFVPAYTRVSRANTLTFAQRDFVLAARALGAGHARILIREILPNVLLPVLAYTFVLVALIIVLEGVLSFLGLGVPHPAPSWGGMINDGREYLDESPHISFIPMAIMFLTVLSFNMVGDTLRKLSDPREAAL